MVLHFGFLEILVIVLVGCLELAGIVALGVIGRVLAAVGVELEAHLADRDLDVSVGELLDANLGRQRLGARARRLDRRRGRPFAESLTVSSRSGSTRPRNRRSSSVSSELSPSVSAEAKSLASIANSPGLSRLSPAGVASACSRVVFLEDEPDRAERGVVGRQLDHGGNGRVLAPLRPVLIDAPPWGC